MIVLWRKRSEPAKPVDWVPWLLFCRASQKGGGGDYRAVTSVPMELAPNEETTLNWNKRGELSHEKKTNALHSSLVDQGNQTPKSGEPAILQGLDKISPQLGFSISGCV